MMHFWAKFALFGIPSIVLLISWHRSTVRSRGLYRLSWGNTLAYIAWLAIGTALERLSRNSDWVPDSAEGLLIAMPLIAGGLSLVLLVWSRFAIDDEKWKMASTSTLMLILWLSSIVAPN
jgi:hypothetical protein